MLHLWAPAPGGHLTPLDHDHSTGKVRGILCFCCNNALADFQEDPELLKKGGLLRVLARQPGESQLARRRALSLVGR